MMSANTVTAELLLLYGIRILLSLVYVNLMSLYTRHSNPCSIWDWKADIWTFSHFELSMAKWNLIDGSLRSNSFKQVNLMQVWHVTTRLKLPSLDFMFWIWTLWKWNQPGLDW